MAARYWCLLLGTLAILRASTAQWSGFVNVEGDPVDFACPEDLALSGIASEFDIATSDRRWEFLCSSGGGLANVSLSCLQQPAINELLGEMDYECPDNGFLAGLSSVFTADSTDRVWTPTCCTRPFARLINCEQPTSTWENTLRDPLNFTAPGEQIIAGIESFYFNRDRRWRFRTCNIEVDCGDPGVPANAVRDGDNFLYNQTVTFTCNNGYYQSSGPEGGVRRCLDTGLWSDTQPICTGCTAIANCADTRCTDPTDQLCEQCSSNQGPALGERGYTNLGTQCQPKCSWLTTFCYPGVCPDLPSSCNCTQGFEGNDCLQISESPVFESCMVSIFGQDGSEASLSCQPNNTAELLYTNIVPYRLSGDWGVVYTPPTLLPPTPAYVDGFSVGVAISEIQAVLFRASNPLSAVSMTTHPCESVNVSPDNPVPGVIVCSSNPPPTNLTHHTFLHGDTFEIRTVTNTGGYLDIIDLDSPALLSQRHYYNATPTVSTVTMVIDIQPPTHCSLVSTINCATNQNILSLSGDIVSTNEIVASWGGWIDFPSGIESYDISVHYLELSNGLLTEGALLRSNQTSQTGQASYTDITILPREGPYSFILRSHDIAGNVRIARRTLLYDVNSTVEIDPLVPLLVTSAVPSTDYTWHNSTERNITISGIGYFYNTHLRDVNYLAPLANYSMGGEVGVAYDQVLAQGRFPRDGVKNALGIIQLNYDVVIDRVGGNHSNSVTPPSVFPFQTSDIGIENVVIGTEIRDGDSMTVWFQAIDFRFQSSVDSVLVHVDSSPPVLSDIGLYWNGVSGLSLHGTGTLLDLDIQFQAQDPHSGLFSIEWSLSTIVGSSIVGSGRVSVPMVSVDDCILPECVCDSLHHCSPVLHSIRPSSTELTNTLALHDTDYIVTVTVTNYARISATISHRFTVDATPPLQGHVMDGNGSRDIDYQSNFELYASWSGFFDRETDVAFYQYVFDSECVNSSYFAHPLTPTSEAIQTFDTLATWTAPEEGTYIVTVVAYNQALQRTIPVCSDGVTIDTVAPLIGGVVIPSAVVLSGLAREDEAVWLVRSDRTRVYVGTCTNMTIPIADLSSYPIEDDVLPDDVCTSSTIYTPSQITHLTRDHTLNISWTATDNIGISYYEVAIVTPENLTNEIAYSRTAGQQHYSFYDSELLSNGNVFYFILRAFDFVEQSATMTIGPIAIDVTPPTLNGTLLAAEVEGRVTVTWSNDVFQDKESNIEQFEFAIGQTKFGTQISDFSPVILSRECPTPFCVVIETEPLSLLSGRNYFVTIKATNQARLSSYLSTPFTHLTPSLRPGYVYDVDPTHTFSLTSDANTYKQDIDILLGTDRLAIAWAGFTHPHLSHNYSVSLGTSPGLDDIVPVTNVYTVTEYEFTNVTLVGGVTYYATVAASNGYDRVGVSSDGVLVLPSLQDALNEGNVLDGLSQDIDFQISTTSVSANWAFPSLISAHLSWYEWSLLGDGDTILPYTMVAMDTAVNVFVENQLIEGVLYQSAVRPCYRGNCLDPVLSDGFYISVPPRLDSVRVVYTPSEGVDVVTGVSRGGSMALSWDVSEGAGLVYYEWSVGGVSNGRELVTNWNRAYEESVIEYLNATISLHTPNIVTVRIFNIAGLYTQQSVPLQWEVKGQILPQDEVPRNELVVFDITESDVPRIFTDNWKEIEHVFIAYTDEQYSNDTSLSGVWPTLRYATFDWSISTQQEFTVCLDDDPYAISCGSTINNAATATNLDLVDGQRYYFCVRGLLSNAIHPTPHTPHTLTACSNGITADLSPPESGCVQIITFDPKGNDEIGSGGSGISPVNLDCESEIGISFQVPTSEVFIVWTEFIDVEQYEGAWHVAGVTNYEYAIGTSPGATDILDFTSVGVANYAVARDLTLTTGFTYYATIRGTDFVGHVTYAHSQPVTVDTTTPTVSEVWIEGAGTFSRDGLTLRWSVPREDVSGVRGVEWAVGSAPGSSDLIGWTSIDVIATETLVDGSQFSDGQIIFLSMKVTNGAGLTSIHSSTSYTLDETPPTPGVVYDGPYINADISDLDFTSDLTTLQSHWSDFVDPHTDVVEYFIAIGTRPGYTDVHDTITVGTVTSVTLSPLPLVHGLTYYTTVTACNALGGCSSVSSNGITVDVTPPIPGRVFNTHTGPDIQHQASTSTISGRWIGFHDDESGLQHFIYYIGHSPNDSSIATPTLAPPTQTSFSLTLLTPLTQGTFVYITVVAVNGAGVKVQASSSGLYIDNTPPKVVDPVTMDTAWAGSMSNATQYGTSAFRLQWNYSDSQTSVNNQFWSLRSQSSVRAPLPGQALGSHTLTTVTRLTLQDGDVHSVHLIGCNQAGLCARSTSPYVLFDSSPPIDGYFAVDTESMASLNRTVAGGNTWRNRNLRGVSEIDIAFLGFSDPHSGIVDYWVSVGTLLGGADLLTSEEPEMIDPVIASKERDVSLARVILNRVLVPEEVLYVSLWAVNGVGLKSLTVQSSFTVDPPTVVNNNGTLTLQRSSNCTLNSCLGHCTCTVRGEVCPLAMPTSCLELSLTTLTPEQRVTIRPLTHPPNNPLFTALTDKLQAEITLPTTADTLYMEWSVSEEGFPPGVGVISSDGLVWRAVDGQSLLIFSSVEPLSRSYVFHVRVWYNFTSFALFTSDAVTVDTVGIVTTLGERVRVNDDRRFTFDLQELSISIENVFIPSPLATFRVAIGDSYHGDNVHPYTTVDPLTNTVLMNLDLRDGRTYYITAQGISPHGLITTSTSRPLTVDLNPPTQGYMTNVRHNMTDFSARWEGFTDPISGIHHYEIALTPSQAPPTQYTDVGIAMRGRLDSLSLTHSTTYYPHLVAVSNADIRSEDYTLPEGIVVDATPPFGLPNNVSDVNLVLNPSFEPSNGTECFFDIENVTMGWSLNGEPRPLSLYDGVLPVRGCSTLLFTGTLSQDVRVVEGVWYRAAVSGRVLTSSTRLTMLVGGVSVVCDMWREWSGCSTLFQARGSLTTLEFRTPAYDGVIVDDVTLIPLSDFTNALVGVANIPIDSDNAIKLSVDFIGQSRARLQADWLIADPESRVSNYVWSIGTVRGGRQKQGQRSTGTRPFGTSEPLLLTHNEVLHVTVIATNNAGLSTTFYSRPFVVDHTPPDVRGHVWDSVGGDVDYQGVSVVWADWSSAISDPESGLSTCTWGIGTTPGATDVQPFTVMSDDVTSSHSDDLSPLLTHGTTVYSTVTCLNGAGFTNTAYSDGVTILTNPPNATSAYAVLSSPDVTSHDIILGYLPSNRLTLRWGGFAESAETPLQYEVCVTNSSNNVCSNWTNIGFLRQLKLNDIVLLSNESHVIELRAVNLGRVSSQPIRTEFTILSTPPLDSGIRVNNTWLSFNTLSFDWSDKFSSPAPLRYELSLGTGSGSGSVLKWAEFSAEESTLVLSHSKLLITNDYYLTLTAISASGLTLTRTQVIAGVPLTT